MSRAHARALLLAFGLAASGARIAFGASPNTSATSVASAATPTRLGPSCRVQYRQSIQQMVETVAPALQSTSRADLAAASQAWRALRFDSGLTPHAGPPTTSDVDLAARLPAGLPLPPTLESFDLLFVHPGDRASDRAVAQLDASGSGATRQTLAFVVNVTGAEFEEARRRLPRTLRGVFPASPGWARFLGVTTYPALVRVRNGVAHVRSGEISSMDESTPAAPTGGS